MIADYGRGLITKEQALGAVRDKMWRIRSKVWLELDGKPIIGEGRWNILHAIEKSGSIVGASRVTGISYRRIWGAIQDMEQAVGHPIVLTQRGGSKGGGTELTFVARDLMERFQQSQKGIRDKVDGRFEKTFG